MKCIQTFLEIKEIGTPLLSNFAEVDYWGE
jgi:hypothetical protein